MPRKCGRPAKDEPSAASRQQIIDATAAIIKEHGAGAVTIRRVIEEARISNGTFYYYFHNKDDLMVSFLRDDAFRDCPLETPPSDIGGCVAELYMKLIEKYRQLGFEFMKKFYTPDNRALSEFIGDTGDAACSDSIVRRSLNEIQAAITGGYLASELDASEAASDCCTIVKGCVFSWCLEDGREDIEPTLSRLLRNYFQRYQVK